LVGLGHLLLLLSLKGGVISPAVSSDAPNLANIG
jgi:hypothetical protein